MAAMGAESTPIVAARATIRNMDRIAWMKRVASRCARATVARTRARPLHSQNVLVSQSTAPCNSRSSRRARGRCIGRGSSRGPSELVSAEVLKMVSAPNFAVNSRFFPNRAEFRPAPAVYRQFIMGKARRHLKIVLSAIFIFSILLLWRFKMNIHHSRV